MDGLVLVLVLAIVTAVLGVIELIKTRGQSLLAWAAVSIGVAMGLLVGK